MSKSNNRRTRAERVANARRIRARRQDVRRVARWLGAPAYQVHHLTPAEFAEALTLATGEVARA